MNVTPARMRRGKDCLNPLERPPTVIKIGDDEYGADSSGVITLPKFQIIIDDVLDEDSTNPVQNKVITLKIDDIIDSIDAIEDELGDAAIPGTVRGDIAGVNGRVDSLEDDKADKTALNSHVADTNNPHNVTKAQVGLSNVDNTSDANKPISTATQSALNGKQDLIVKGGNTTHWWVKIGNFVTEGGQSTIRITGANTGGSFTVNLHYGCTSAVNVNESINFDEAYYANLMSVSTSTASSINVSLYAITGYGGGTKDIKLSWISHGFTNN